MPRQIKVQKPKDTKKTFARLLSYMKPYAHKVIFAYILMMLASFGGVLTSYFLKPIINQYIIPRDFDGLIVILLQLFLIFIFIGIASYIYRKIMIDTSQKVIYTIRQELFAHVEKMPISFFDQSSHGDLMSRFTNDIDNLNDALATSILDLLSAAVSLIGTVVMMIILSPSLFIITIVCLIAMGLSAKSIGTRSKNYFKAQQKDLGEINGFIEEMVSWTKVIKVFRYEKEAISQFDEKSEKLRLSQTKAQEAAMSMMPTTANISYIFFAILCVVGSILSTMGHFDIGTLVAYLQYSRQLVGPVGHATQNINSIFSALAGAERVFQVMDQKVEIDEGDYDLVKLEDVNGELKICYNKDCKSWGWFNKKTGDLKPLEGRIQFENVSFAYEEGKEVLKNLSFYAEPGQKLAFVGSTGAGKTTIMNLITRFYEISEGRILYDGLDIKDIKKSALRRSFGMVLQDVNLFSGSIRENIAYGDSDVTDEEIEKAAELSNSTSFIKHLKDGYNTKISASGTELSQGERQLLSIARAALTDPPVLILDEATSSVDTRTERIIQEAMYKLMADRTVLVIAHRLSTIHDSDVIFVMEHGQIIERGDHKSLMEKKARYYQLYTGNEILT